MKPPRPSPVKLTKFEKDLFAPGTLTELSRARVTFYQRSEPIKIINVKNLGWLLRHWKDVNGFELTKFKGGFPKGEGYMKAYCTINGQLAIYETLWSSYDLMFDFCQRSIFKGLPGTIYRDRTEGKERE